MLCGRSPAQSPGEQNGFVMGAWPYSHLDSISASGQDGASQGQPRLVGEQRGLRAKPRLLGPGAGSPLDTAEIGTGRSLWGRRGHHGVMSGIPGSTHSPDPRSIFAQL